jgi:hypothetical protein
MGNTTTGIPATVTLTGVLLAAACWGQHEALAATRTQILNGELQPIATLLKENGALERQMKRTKQI